MKFVVRVCMSDQWRVCMSDHDTSRNIGGEGANVQHVCQRGLGVRLRF